MPALGRLVAALSLLAACGSDHERPASTDPSAVRSPVPDLTSSGAAASVSASAEVSSATPIASAASPPSSFPRAYDMHCDTPYQVRTKGRSPELDTGHITPDTLRRGHVGAVFFAIYLSDKLHKGHPTVKDADDVLATVDTIVSKHPDLFWPADKGPAPEGKVIPLLSIEGAGAFAEDITQIDRFIRRGVKFVGPVHMKNDALASSATDQHEGGLTALGQRFVRRVYADGALVDVSHMSDEGFWDVAKIAKEVGAPIVATHSDARAVADLPRNLTDAELAAIGESGGVVGVNFYDGYLRAGGNATMADVVAQTLHMVKVAGIDHVGIGSDFDGSTPPADLPDASAFPAFADALEKAGLSPKDVEKIFGENVKRVLAWRPKGATRGPEASGDADVKAP
jgi:membrane dipeptidase